MTQTVVKFTTPEARLVGGHPMERNVIRDDKTNLPKMDDLGEPRLQTYLAIAIPKGSETDWKHTPAWGALMKSAAESGWPNGEHGAPAFAWKVIDGDSKVPNRKGKKPCDREGYPGHWVISCSTEIPVKCFHVGKYDPIDQIRDSLEIKRGDYIRVQLQVRGNAPSQSPGIYVNPTLVEFRRAGVLIVGEGPDANEAFGTPEQLYGATSTPPVNAKRMAPGCQFTYEALLAANWTDAQMRANGYLL